MPAKSKAQFRFMEWVQHNPEEARKSGVTISASKAKEFTKATPSYKKLPARKKKK